MSRNLFFHSLASYKRSLFASAILFPFFAIAQNNIAIAPLNMNVLYIGVDNPVAVAASNIPEEKVRVEITGGSGTIQKAGTGLYNVKVFAVTDECILKLYADGQLLGSSVFRVRTLPPPQAAVGLYESGTNIPAATFRDQLGVALTQTNVPFYAKYEVVSYTLSMDTDKGHIVDAVNNGPLFSPKAKQIIEEHIKPGRLVTIDKIVARDAKGHELKLPSLVYYIK